MEAKFVHLHVHSNFSLLSGGSAPRDLLLRAKELGMDALALTDTDALYAAVPFYRSALEMGIRPILGSELAAREGRVLVLARDRKGYGHLCRLITKRQLAEEAFSLCEDLPALQEGLLFFTNDPGLLFRLADRIDRGSLFAEMVIHPGAHYASDPPLSPPGKEEAPAHSPCPCLSPPAHPGRLARLARKLNLPLAASNRVYFSRPEDYRIHRVLRAVGEGALLSGIPKEVLAHPEAYLKPASAMQRLFAEFSDALEGAADAAESCRLDLTLGRPIFPLFPLPGGESARSWLWKLCLQGARMRYPAPGPAVLERLRYELEIIHRQGFAEYFLIVWDIVNFAQSRNIPLVGRGSAADSLVAYVLGLTSVDPIEHNLYFERFLNPSRTDCPDIDLDFCWKRRDEVLEYVYRKYGYNRVAMVCTFNTFQIRSAFREVAKAFGLSLQEIDSLSAGLPHFHPGGIREAVEHLPECRSFPIHHEPFRTIVDLVSAVEGFPRHLSIHPGGIVITDKPLTWYLPLERAAKGLVITQFDMDSVEEIGLVKIDLLGQRALSVITDTLAAVKTIRGESPNLEALDGRDEKTADLLQKGRTIGCFQIESPGMRNLLQMMKARNRWQAIVALSLIRPGPAAAGMKEHYVRRMHGLEKPAYLHPGLKKVLGETFGIMLFQEDILKVASVVAGFTLAEADALRKAISKNRDPRMMLKMQNRFLQGARSRGVAKKSAEILWRSILNFTGYSYCKAHATTYGYLSYKCAYLKAHYPAEFLAAVLANEAGFYEKRVYLEEARRLGVKILLPHINRSQERCAAEAWFHGDTGSSASARCALRIGLDQVRDLSRKTLEAALREQVRSPFVSLNDFVRRTGAGLTETENLILCGAFDFLGFSRPQFLWHLKLCHRLLLKERPEEERLFSKDASSQAAEGVLYPLLPLLPDYPLERRIALEQEILGFTVSAHPLSLFEDVMHKRNPVRSTHLNRFVGKEVTVGGWLVTTRRVRTGARGYMRFLTLEDHHGTMELSLFPKAYRSFGHLITSYGPYFARGKVEDQHGALTINVESLEVDKFYF